MVKITVNLNRNIILNLFCLDKRRLNKKRNTYISSGDAVFNLLSQKSSVTGRF